MNDSNSKADISNRSKNEKDKENEKYMNMTPEELEELIEENKQEVKGLLKEYFVIMEKEERQKRHDRATQKRKSKKFRSK